jgi:hypothetical protein
VVYYLVALKVVKGNLVVVTIIRVLVVVIVASVNIVGFIVKEVACYTQVVVSFEGVIIHHSLMMVHQS